MTAIIMFFWYHLFVFAVSLLFASGAHGWPPSSISAKTRTIARNATPPNSNDTHSQGDGVESSQTRRFFLNGVAIGSILATGLPRPALAAKYSGHAKVVKSRSEGYAVSKSDDEWKALLTPRQYDIMRSGGTESPYSSVLVGEKRSGAYDCAGCGTPLFESAQKFNSFSGWPSFAAGTAGTVEVEPIQMYQRMVGAEMRCATCGGHLGDVYSDGYLFVGTPAVVSGKRFCTDGAALVFRPQGEGAEVTGDQVPESPFSWRKQ